MEHNNPPRNQGYRLGHALVRRQWHPFLWLCLAFLIGSVAEGVAFGGRLVITVIDRETKQPIACRMHLKNAAGKPRRVRGVPFWADHFALPGKVTLDLPVGNYTFELERGPEYLTHQGHFTINNFADDTKQIEMQRFIDMSAEGWWSGDLDVRRPVSDIELLMKAEDLHMAQVITRHNGKNLWPGKTTPKEPLVRFDTDRLYHHMAASQARNGTELLYFNLSKPLALPGSRSEFPPPMTYLTEARKQDDTWVDLSKPFWWDLPMLVALGQIDSIQIAHSHIGRASTISHEADGKPRDKLFYPPPTGNARWSQEIYFHLLECGLRIPPSAGSGSGEVPNPVGYNRMYVHVDGPADGPLDYRAWWKAFDAGRVLITNGPLLRPYIKGKLPGHVFHVEKGETLDLEIGLILNTRVPISYIELIKNGKVDKSLRLEQYAEAAQENRLPKLHFERSGWFLVRAVSDTPKTYRFVMTAPYYVEVDYRRRISKRSVQFFIDWVYERARQIKLPDPAQQRQVLGYHRQARDFWQDLAEKANAP